MPMPTKAQTATRNHLADINRDCAAVEQYLGDQEPEAQMILRFDTGGVPKVFLIYINGDYEDMEPWP